MKKLILALGIVAMLIASQIVFGQTTEGVVEFEVKVNMHRSIPADRAEMKEMMPEFNVLKDQLFFKTDESLYKPVEEEDDDFADNGGPVRMRFKRPNAEIYFNTAQSKRIVLQEFMGKKYWIEDSIKIAPWKFGTETKTILGYPCKQASYFNEETKRNIVAWYTDKLRPFLGPESFNTLPGTVLQVDINGGERIITALKIDARPLKKNELKVPAASGAEKTTQKEFDKATEAQRERMRANGGNIIIRN